LLDGEDYPPVFTNVTLNHKLSRVRLSANTIDSFPFFIVRVLPLTNKLLCESHRVHYQHRWERKENFCGVGWDFLFFSLRCSLSSHLVPSPGPLVPFSPSHLVPFSPSHLLIFSSSHLLTFSPSLLLSFSPSHLFFSFLFLFFI
jgi:hypothetical protein